jgi:hypothetical protein
MAEKENDYEAILTVTLIRNYGSASKQFRLLGDGQTNLGGRYKP